MFWLPQPTIGVVPAGAGVVSFDSWGQATFQQPMQVVPVLPMVTTGVSNVAGFVQGVAGLVLGSGAALNGSNGGGRGGRARRQTRRRQEPEPVFEDCQEEETTETSQESPADPASPKAAAQDSARDVGELNAMMAQLEEGGKPRSDAIASIQGMVLQLALDPVGCRLIQLALDVASQNEASELASELQGYVAAAMESKHANYVLQKIIEVLPISKASFVVEELQDTAVDVARHRYGCRILCRLFEHAATEGGTAKLISALLVDARDLSRHAYGYHVIRSILEHGLPEDRHRIAAALSGGVHRYAKHRTASFVVEKALAHCGDDARNALARELLERPETTVDLARHQFGRHVISQLVRLPNDCSQKALDNLRRGLPQVQSSKHGRRLVEELRGQLMTGTAAAA